MVEHPSEANAGQEQSERQRVVRPTRVFARDVVPKVETQVGRLGGIAAGERMLRLERRNQGPVSPHQPDLLAEVGGEGRLRSRRRERSLENLRRRQRGDHSGKIERDGIVMVWVTDRVAWRVRRAGEVGHDRPERDDGGVECISAEEDDELDRVRKSRDRVDV